MMDRAKLGAVLAAMDGITYQEWNMISECIERKFKQKLNRSQINSVDTEEMIGRMEVELDAYFCR